MKKSKVTLIGTVVILFITTFLFINNSLSKGDVSEVPLTISIQQQAENERKVTEIEKIYLRRSWNH